MTLLVKDIDDVKHAFKEIDIFSKISGLKLNKKKSVAMWIGANKFRLETDESITWVKNDETIKILGIHFNAKTEASLIQKNWEEQKMKIKETISRWSKRNLSLYGKNIILKTFILSKLNFIIQALFLPEKELADIDRILFKFLWKKNNSNQKAFEKIKRSTMCKDYNEGGLACISIKDQQKVFLVN